MKLEPGQVDRLGVGGVDDIERDTQLQGGEIGPGELTVGELAIDLFALVPVRVVPPSASEPLPR